MFPHGFSLPPSRTGNFLHSKSFKAISREKEKLSKLKYWTEFSYLGLIKCLYKILILTSQSTEADPHSPPPYTALSTPIPFIIRHEIMWVEWIIWIAPTKKLAIRLIVFFLSPILYYSPVSTVQRTLYCENHWFENLSSIANNFSWSFKIRLFY